MSLIKLTVKNLVEGRDSGIKLVKKDPADSGIDLFSPRFALIPTTIQQKVETNIAIQARFDEASFPTKELYNFYKNNFNIELKIEGCSGNATKGLQPIGGVVDMGYQGNIGVVLVNNNKHNEITISRGDKIAQVVVHLIPKISQDDISYIGPKDAFEEITDRGTDGFGSTGIVGENNSSKEAISIDNIKAELTKEEKTEVSTEEKPVDVETVKPVDVETVKPAEKKPAAKKPAKKSK